MVFHSFGFLFLLLPALALAQDDCIPCADGLEPFLFLTCAESVDKAGRLTNGTDQCKENQLTTFQDSCCDSPPPDFCTLCSDGSTDYQADKIIPRSTTKMTREYTCEEAATLVRFLTDDVTTTTLRTGDCQFTPRERSGAWCGCGATQQQQSAAVCDLKCPDGNPPPDLELAEPVFGKTCLRFMYEFTTLNAEECPNAASELNFDAVAFCCPTVAVVTSDTSSYCSICPSGTRQKDPALEVQTQFFGNVTCGELHTHASFLPSSSTATATTTSACSDLILELDIREGQDCCEIDPDAVTLSPVAAPAGDGATNTMAPPSVFSFWLLGLMGVVFSILPIV